MTLPFALSIKVRTRRVSLNSAEDSFASRFQSCYQSIEPEEQLWALSQIPLRGLPNSAFIEGQCFQYFCSHLNPNDDELVQALQKAIERELKSPALSPKDHFHKVVPIVVHCIQAGVPGRWAKMLHTIGKTLKEPEVVAEAYNYVAQLLSEHRSHSDTAVANLIRGLCAGGSVIPNTLITELLLKPQVIEECYYPFLMSVLANFTPSAAQSAIEQVLRDVVSQASLLNAVLRLPNIPERLLMWVRMTIADCSENVDIACAVIRNRQRVVNLGIMTEVTVLQLVWQSGLFIPKYYNVIAEYFYKAMDKIGERDALMLMQRICQSNSPHSLKLIRQFMTTQRNEQSTNFVVKFLSQKPSFVDFQEWTSTISAVLPRVPETAADTLTETLAASLSTEVSTGHTCTRKRVMPDIEPRFRQKDGPLRVKGWREISALITALSQSPSIWVLRTLGPKLIRESLDVHSYPIIPAVISLLKVIAPTAQDDVVGLLTDLLNGNSLRQKIAMKIIPEMTKTLSPETLVTQIGTRVAHLALESPIPDVKCAALRTLPSFTDLGETFYKSPILEMALNAFDDAKLSEDPQLHDTAQTLANDYAALEPHAPRIRTRVAKTPPPKSATPKRTPKQNYHERRNSENTDTNAVPADKPFKPQSFLVRPYVKRPSLQKSKRGPVKRRPSAPMSPLDWLD